MAPLSHSEFEPSVGTETELPPDFHEALAMERTGKLIPAAELPSAAAQLAELFPDDETTAATFADMLYLDSSDTRDDSALHEVIQIPNSPQESSTAALLEAQVQRSAEAVALDPFDFSALAPIEPPLASAAAETSGPSSISAEALPISMEAAPTLPFLTEPPAVPLPVEPASEPINGSSDRAFEKKLASHIEWLQSKGAIGKKANLASADLEGAELISVNLRLADLRDVNFKAADLLLADLRDASLIRANLQDSCLVGANLEGANLEGASLESAMGVVPHQLAGTNLHDASLPKPILKFDALSEFERGSQMASRFFVATTSLSFLSWLVIWRTRDIQLLANLSVLGFLHSPAAAAALPADQFYLMASVALFIVYLVFHFHLQRLWDATFQLPAIFPDGHALGEHAPRLVTGLLRAHFRWMNRDAPSTRFIEKAIAMVVAYWLVPLTLLLYWARYLTLQDIHGTILQDLLVTVAAGVALYSTTHAGRPAERWSLPKNSLYRALEKLRKTTPAAFALGLGVCLTFLSAGTMAGVPHERVRAPQYSAASIRRWASGIFWSVGFEPYANLTESVLSAAPTNWSGTDDQLGLVTGARLNGANFRYAQAYGIFLAKAHLFQSDFQGASLSASDFREADMGQTNLRYAMLDAARMTRVNLDRAFLDGAYLGRADLRGANLSYGSLLGTFLKDVRLDAATLYGANLTYATMVRANLQKADLREAHLDDANLDHADLRQAYLWSATLSGAHLDNAQLANAIFIDADLRDADLRGAQLSGTVLSGANLSGANLDGLNLRVASSLTAAQICSAKSRRWLLLDDMLQAQVTAQCGAQR